MGDTVELCCEASPPILYQFYHDDVNLENVSAPSEGGVSFNLSLTTGHSRNYSCEADYGLGALCSGIVPLSISSELVIPGYRSIMINGSVPEVFIGTILRFQKMDGVLGHVSCVWEVEESDLKA